MNLEVGMYVRTNKGRIGKVLTEKYEYKDDYNQEIQFKDDVEYTWDMDWEDIIKASHSLLGNDKEPCLIEVGDYVNGYEVVEEPCNDNFAIGQKHLWLCDRRLYLLEKDIKSIVTKEQFEEMSYKVGE